VRAASLLFIVALLASSIPLQSGLVAGASGVTGSQISSTLLSLGFGPSSLAPVSAGVPVYAVGETIWAESGYNYSIPLSLTSARASASAPIRVVEVKLLAPQVVTPLYTFTSADADGVWNITIGGLQGTAVIPVHFVNLADHPVSLGPLLYSLDKGNISISAQANLGDSYDQEVCAGGASATNGVSLSLPTDMGDKGLVTLSPGTPFNVITSGRVNDSFSFWFELFHPYSLEATDSNSLVLNNLMAAESRPVTFVSQGSMNTTVTWNMPLRDGRYGLRAFFQNSTSLDVFQSRILVVNASSWVPLSVACPPQPVLSQDVSYSASLTNNLATWPHRLYVMYRTLGVEAVSSYPVRANLSSVDFVASPWNTRLRNFTVSVSPAPGVQTTQGGDSLFVSATRYPVKLNYTLDFNGGHSLAQGSVTLTEGLSQTSDLKLAQLTVHILSDQSSPTTLEVTGPQGVEITNGTVGTNETSSFLLPTGSYTVTASQGDNTQSEQVSLTDGLAEGVTLNFNTFLTFEIILAVTAIMAAVANLAVWIFNSRSLRSRLASTPKGT
jgi:hypothetical protein